MKWIKIFAYNLVIGIVLFLLIDFVYTRSLLPSLQQKATIIKHPAFDYTLRSGVDETTNTNRLCTDTNGFKVHCDDINRSSLAFDVVFIGDSFTEGVTLNYEDTFVGMYDLAHPSLKVANLGVRGYSPTRYLKKISHYIKKGLKTEHVVVFIDISDMYNEAILHNYESLLFLKTILFIHKNLTLTEWLTANLLTVPVPCMPIIKFRYFECILYNRGSFGEHWTYRPSTKAFEPLGLSGTIEKLLGKMEELSKLLNKHGIKLSVGVYPWPHQLRYDNVDSLQVEIWKKFCEQKCFAFINAFPPFFSLKEELGLENTLKRHRLHDGRDMHFNKNGNEVVFEVLNREFNATQ